MALLYSKVFYYGRFIIFGECDCFNFFIDCKKIFGTKQELLVHKKARNMLAKYRRNRTMKINFLGIVLHRARVLVL